MVATTTMFDNRCMHRTRKYFCRRKTRQTYRQASDFCKMPSAQPRPAPNTSPNENPPAHRDADKFVQPPPSGAQIACHNICCRKSGAVKCRRHFALSVAALFAQYRDRRTRTADCKAGCAIILRKTFRQTRKQSRIRAFVFFFRALRIVAAAANFITDCIPFTPQFVQRTIQQLFSTAVNFHSPVVVDAPRCLQLFCHSGGGENLQNFRRIRRRNFQQRPRFFVK